jgi:SAM-dependent methyltransferase
MGVGPLLDVGCGNGRHLELAAQRGIPGIGVDVSAELLRIARGRLGDGADLILADASDLPVVDASVGGAMTIAVLHHIRSEEMRRGAASELHRVLVPGGRLLVSTWALDDPTIAERAGARSEPGGEDGDLLVPWRAPGGPKVDRYYHALTLDGLTGLIRDAGLEVIVSTDREANHVVEAKRVSG